MPSSNDKRNPQQHGSMTLGEGDHIYPAIRQRGGIRHIPSLNCPCSPVVEPSVVSGEGHAIHNDADDPAFPVPPGTPVSDKIRRNHQRKRQVINIAKAAGVIKDTVSTSTTPVVKTPRRARLIKRR